MGFVPEHEDRSLQVVALVTEGAQRPELPAPEDLPGTGTFAGYSEYIMLMEQCWDQDPAARPTFAQVCIAATIPDAMVGDVLQNACSCCLHVCVDACGFFYYAPLLSSVWCTVLPRCWIVLIAW